MQEENPLFTEISAEESAAISGGIGVRFDLDTYLYILGAGVVFGNPGLTSDEIHFAWMSAFIFNDNQASNSISHIHHRSSSRRSRSIFS